MSLILMRNETQCPACARYGGIRWDQRECSHCHRRLFKADDDFVAINQELMSSYYVWFPLGRRGMFQGWVHSDHLNQPKPYTDSISLEKPGKNYGKRELPKGCSSALA